MEEGDANKPASNLDFQRRMLLKKIHDFVVPKLGVAGSGQLAEIILQFERCQDLSQLIRNSLTEIA
ncbi:hypothetical protein D3C84_1262680 [compost metagenome]